MLACLEAAGYFLPCETQLVFVFTIYKKEGKLRLWWQAEKHFWEVFILILFSLNSFSNSMYHRKVYSQAPPPPSPPSSPKDKTKYVTIS